MRIERIWIAGVGDRQYVRRGPVVRALLRRCGRSMPRPRAGEEEQSSGQGGANTHSSLHKNKKPVPPSAHRLAKTTLLKRCCYNARTLAHCQVIARHAIIVRNVRSAR